MDPVSGWFLAAIAGVGALSLLTFQRHAAVMTVLLLASWGATKLLVACGLSWLAAYHIYPALHLVILGATMAVWWAKPEPWKLGVGLAVMTALFIDFGYWAFADKGRETLWNYILALNILFGIEIFCVFLAGGGAIGRAVSKRMLASRALHRRVLPAHGRSAKGPKAGP
jgi:hypothetical protein